MADFEEISFQNPHWFGKNETEKKKRRLFGALVKGLDNRFICSLQGIRRVGKTTLLRQIMHYLVSEKKVKPERILYFSFDDAPHEPRQVVHTWASRFGIDLHSPGVYVFFDEIQKVGRWGEKLKVLYDNTKIKFFLSGSSSLLLSKGNESLAGREFSYELPPFAFDEWMEFCGLPKEAATWELYEKYLFSQFPQIAQGEVECGDYVRSIIDKVIEHDIPKAFGIGYSDRLKAIFQAMLKQPGQMIEYNDIAKDFGISRDTASKYFHALENSFLLRKVENALPNARKSEKALKKYYPYVSSLTSAILPYPVDFALIVESDAAFELGARYFFNERGKEIDFIVGKKLDIGVEVKMRARIDKSDVKCLLGRPLRERYVVVKPETKLNVMGVKPILPMNLWRLKLS